jgi:hypothetical protein
MEIIDNTSFIIGTERGHYVVYLNGKFYCSADSVEEAYQEVKDYFAKRSEVKTECLKS